MSDAKCGDSHQFTLQSDQTFVSAADVEQRHYIVFLLEDCADCEVADAKNRQRIIGQGDGVTSRIDQGLRRLKIFFEVEGFWRIEFGDDYRRFADQRDKLLTSLEVRPHFLGNGA